MTDDKTDIMGMTRRECMCKLDELSTKQQLDGYIPRRQDQFGDWLLCQAYCREGDLDVMVQIFRDNLAALQCFTQNLIDLNNRLKELDKEPTGKRKRTAAGRN